MKSNAWASFLCGFAVGIGFTLLGLYTRKPDGLITCIERIGELGRIRETRREEQRMDREWLRKIGFSDKEIDESFL